ncbi:DNA-directed RNA polymerase, partial [Basidiobolus meristosporus CBS 931.73]
EVGDKVASRHVQKGVVTITLPQKDLPYTEEGIVPDIFISPHAIPGHMTIDQLLEGFGW